MPDEYQLEIERRARRSLDTFPTREYERLRRAIDALADDPRPNGAGKLQTSEPLWRVRVGNYRIIYAVFDQERLVKVVRVERRTTQTYERL